MARRSRAVPSFGCPNDLTVEAGRYSGVAIARAGSRVNDPNTGPFGATSYPINAQACSVSYVRGHPVKATGTIASLTDGTSNTLLLGERFAMCTGPDFPVRLRLLDWLLDRSPLQLGRAAADMRRMPRGPMVDQLLPTSTRRPPLPAARIAGGTAPFWMATTATWPIGMLALVREAIRTFDRTGTAASSIQAASKAVRASLRATTVACKACTME